MVAGIRRLNRDSISTSAATEANAEKVVIKDMFAKSMVDDWDIVQTLRD